MIFINFKTYKEASGKSAVELAKTIEEVSRETGIEIIACPQTVDLSAVKQVVSIPLWVQHIDPVEPGKFTGWTSAYSVKEAGAEGTFLNHSEHTLPADALEMAVKTAHDAGLKTLVFVSSPEEAGEVAMLSPEMICFEPPELVGNRATSVAQAKPMVIQEVVRAVAPLPMIVGAGIHSREDIEKSLELGAVGVAVATDVVLADDPQQELLDLVRGF